MASLHSSCEDSVADKRSFLEAFGHSRGAPQKALDASEML